MARHKDDITAYILSNLDNGILQSVHSRLSSFSRVANFRRNLVHSHLMVDFETTYSQTRNWLDTVPAIMRESFPRSGQVVPLMGSLDRFPPEILEMIAKNLDIKTFFNLRLTCVKARKNLSQVIEYRIVTKFAPGCLTGIVRTRA
ncbi:hypothetical protein GE09DRAFT_1231739 [Coniochaeta sp. 2T2.1]|nr:hypothetical protein GE09DRAFT_1231739 [Coniochaeta sp. 2T2.1]